MYWYEIADEECVGYNYSYFQYSPIEMTIQVKNKYVLTHEEFEEWYKLNKSV